jgi:hypothetical protein
MENREQGIVEIFRLLTHQLTWVGDGLMTPNVKDENGEKMNVVDGLFAISRSIDRLARAIEGKKEGT